MQLVLGVRNRFGVGVGTGEPSAPPSPPEERRRLGEHGRRALRGALWLAAFALLATLGALQGASVAIGADGVSELASGEPQASAPAPTPAHEEPADFRGSFWRPMGSDAQRPPSEISPRRWDPRRD